MKTLVTASLCLLAVAAASADAIVSTFTGIGDLPAFEGDYAYAINMGGTWNNADVTMGTATFLDSYAAGGVTLNNTGTLQDTPFYGVAPAYGDGSSLPLLLHGIVMSYGAGASLELSMAVTPGQQYELQMFYSENVYTNAGIRRFDISVENTLILDDFTPIPNEAANWSGAPDTGVFITYQFTAGDDVLNIDLTQGAPAPGVDFNSPYIQAFTLQAVPEPATMSLLGLGSLFLLIVRRRPG